MEVKVEYLRRALEARSADVPRCAARHLVRGIFVYRQDRKNDMEISYPVELPPLADIQAYHTTKQIRILLVIANSDWIIEEWRQLVEDILCA
jgi:hypothetical protein